jgi:hypothetical protein
MAGVASLSAVGLAAMALAWAAPAAAAEPAPTAGQVEVLKGLTACRAITDGPARLDCYDKAAAAIDQAQASGDVVVIDRAQARAARRQVFGFNLSALSILDRTAARDEINTLNSTAAEAYRNGTGKWVIVLDDGAHWRQIDDADLSHAPHAGSVIRIRHASLGSFVMNIDGQPYIHVHRDE